MLCRNEAEQLHSTYHQPPAHVHKLLPKVITPSALWVYPPSSHCKYTSLTTLREKKTGLIVAVSPELQNMIHWTDLPLTGSSFLFLHNMRPYLHYHLHKRRNVSLGSRFGLPQCSNCDVTRAVIPMERGAGHRWGSRGEAPWHKRVSEDKILLQYSALLLALH